MKRQIVISLGYRTEKGMCLLSYWNDYANPDKTRFMRKGRFDVDKWEAAQKHLYMRPGADPRAAWKEAWRMVRTLVREGRAPFGDTSRRPKTRRISLITGYRFEPTMNDDPRRLP